MHSNIKIATASKGVTYHELSESASIAQKKQADTLKQLELSRQMAKVFVPTNERDVKFRLRLLDQPVTLFGEESLDRRERLRALLAQLAVDGKYESFVEQIKTTQVSKPVVDPLTDVAYLAESNNPKELMQMRVNLAQVTLKRAADRVNRENKWRRDMGLDGCVEGQEGEVKVARVRYENQILATTKQLKSYVPCVSYIGDNRVLSGVAVNTNASQISLSSWTGNGHLWSMSENVSDIKEVCVLKTGFTRANDTIFLDSTLVGNKVLVSGVEGVAIFDVSKYNRDDLSDSDVKVEESSMGDQEVPAAHLDPNLKSEDYEDEGDGLKADPYVSHASSIISQRRTPSVSPVSIIPYPYRVNRMATSPCSRYLYTSSHSNSWQYIDIEREMIVLNQVGYTTPTYAIASHADGSLVAVGDLGGHIRLWDVRTGRAVGVLDGHALSILSCDFGKHHNSHMLASGGGDHTARLWDLRMRESSYTIPAHNHVVSDVKFHHTGDFLLTSGYDGISNITSMLSHERIGTYKGHTNKVMRCNWIKDKFITVGFDCTWKMWGSDE